MNPSSGFPSIDRRTRNEMRRNQLLLEVSQGTDACWSRDIRLEGLDGGAFEGDVDRVTDGEPKLLEGLVGQADSE